MEKNQYKGWLYLLPAALFLAAFLVYPLVDVFVYSMEEGYNFASQTSFGVGTYNFSYVLHDPYFLQAVRNTFQMVIITVPLSTGIALHHAAAQTVSDDLFSALRHQYAGSRTGIYGAV